MDGDVKEKKVGMGYDAANVWWERDVWVAVAQWDDAVVGSPPNKYAGVMPRDELRNETSSLARAVAWIFATAWMAARADYCLSKNVGESLPRTAARLPRTAPGILYIRRGSTRHSGGQGSQARGAGDAWCTQSGPAAAGHDTGRE